MDEPLQCPFCGSDNLHIDSSFVECDNCLAHGPVGYGDAIAWNARAYTARLAAADRLAEAAKPFSRWNAFLGCWKDEEDARNELSAALREWDAAKMAIMPENDPHPKDHEYASWNDDPGYF